VRLVPFNRPYVTGSELDYIQEAIDNSNLAGNGPFANHCERWLEEHVNTDRALLTHSCTGALEMSALLLDLQRGDEVILPSFTFSSTANAFALRGAVPVFVDVTSDTFNLDPDLVERAVTDRTRAIVAVHYAGVGCDMEALTEIAARRNLMLIEDAAQGVLSTYRGKPLGGIAPLGAMSFHETKNVISGEGGALLVNDPSMASRAEVLHEKGTDRARFFRGEIDKYTWVDIGSSFPLSEINAAFLWAQLNRAEEITRARLAIWDRYHGFLEPLEQARVLRRPCVPADCNHNGHMYYVLLADHVARDGFIEDLKRRGVRAVFHYVPLHSSPAGRRIGRAHGGFPVTNMVSEQLVRLPLWVGMDDETVAYVSDSVADALAARPTGGIL
jgi:dTDP-4-amino-4,6-dideoxygalactose transaminase